VRIFSTSIALMVAAAGAVGCADWVAVSHDLRGVTSPVLLNATVPPIPGDQTVWAPVGTSAGVVSKSLMVSSGSPGTTYGGVYMSGSPPHRSDDAVCDASVNASFALGGRYDRAIVGLEYDISTLDVYLVVSGLRQESIRVTGQVVQAEGKGPQ